MSRRSALEWTEGFAAVQRHARAAWLLADHSIAMRNSAD